MEAAPPPTRGLSTSPQASPLRLGGAGSPQDRFTPAVCTPDREVQAQTPPPSPSPRVAPPGKGCGASRGPPMEPKHNSQVVLGVPLPLAF